MTSVNEAWGVISKELLSDLEYRSLFIKLISSKIVGEWDSAEEKDIEVVARKSAEDFINFLIKLYSE